MPEKKPFLLRLSPELWEELQRMAGEELRSINGQIEYMLRQALKQRGRQVGQAAPSADDADSP